MDSSFVYIFSNFGQHALDIGLAQDLPATPLISSRPVEGLGGLQIKAISSLMPQAEIPHTATTSNTRDLPRDPRLRRPSNPETASLLPPATSNINSNAETNSLLPSTPTTSANSNYPSASLLVENLDPLVTKDHIEKEFSAFGEILLTHISERTERKAYVHFKETDAGI